MRKSFAARLVSAALALACVLAIPAFADEPQGRIITFRPGMEGSRFSDSYTQYLEEAGYTYEVSSATGSLSVLVTEGQSLPSAPQIDQILPGDDRYQVINVASGYGDTGFSEEYVVEYAMKRQGENYAYTVEYRDRATGAEVAPALQGTSSAVTLTFQAPAVSGYRAETSEASLTITAQGPNALTLWYEAVAQGGETTTVTTPGTVTYQYEDVTLYRNAATANGGAGEGAGGDGTAAGGEEINPDETPLTDGQTRGGTEEIQPDAVPQAGASGQQTGGIAAGVLIGVGVGLAILLLAAVLLLRRKKAGASAR